MAEEKRGKSKKALRLGLYMAAALCAAGGVALLVLFYTTAGTRMKDTAFAEGKQARILIESRTVQGNLAEVQTPAQAKEPAPDASTAPEEAPQAEPEPEPEPEEEASPQDATKPEAQEEQESKLKGSRKEEAMKKESAALSVADQLPPPTVKTHLNGALNPSLQEKVKGVGTLPKISESGLESWQYYGKKDISDPGKPIIALMVTGLGLHHQTTGKALLLPEEISLSYSPYAGQLQQQITRARTYGHEVWLDLPLEPEEYPAVDRGPLTLFHTMKEEEVIQKLHALMGGATTFVGFAGTPEEVFSNYAPMHDVAKEVKSRGMLMLLPSRQYTHAETADHMLYVNRRLDVLEAGQGASPSQLLVELEATAKEYGYAIGTVGDAPHLYQLITTWSATLPEKGLQLAPVTAVVARKKK